jgi:hypothetical protein
MPARRALARSSAVASALALLAAACAAPRAAAPPPAEAGEPLAPGWTRRALDVRGRGQVVLALPPGWTATEGEEGEAAAPAFRLERQGERFRVVVTPLWNPGEPESPEGRADTAQLFAEIARRRALGGSVEDDIPLEELTAPGVKGFFFTATDRELVDRDPAPDEWRCILQGAAAVGPVLLAFTLLDDGPGPQRDDVLAVVRSARFVSDGDPADVADLEPLPGVRTDPLRVGWPGRAWAVLVDLPDFAMGARRAGAGKGPYVVGIQDATGLVASVAIRPAEGAGTAAACRDAALRAIRQAVREAAGFQLGDAGAAARVAYTVGGAGPPQANGHVFLQRDGFCVDVHVSKTDPGAEDAARIDAILASVRIAEDL